MKPVVRLAWHFGGLAAAITGAVQMGGWPAGLLTVGMWAMIATVVDAYARDQRKQERV